MAVYATVIMVILAIIMAVFILLSILKEDSNNKKNQHNIIYPFNAKLQSRDHDNPKGELTVNLLTSDNKPQLQCPAGTHIEIIGAWTDIVDPNGICSNKPSATFKMSCGFADDQSAGVFCQDTSDCAPGMTCSGSGACVPLACKDNIGCGSSACGKERPSDSVVGDPCGGAGTFVANDGLVCINNVIHKDPSAGQCLYCDTRRGDSNSPGYCAQSPSCANLTTSAQNNTCIDKKCAPRDSSAYVASICDGKRVCTMPGSSSTLMYDPTKFDIFGPKPCAIDVDVNWKVPGDDGSVSSYEQLPVAAGWGGGQPGSGQYVGAQGQPSTYSQGFFVHGIFNCIPDE